MNINTFDFRHLKIATSYFIGAVRKIMTRDADAQRRSLFVEKVVQRF
jgi:hypothetical protein